MQTLSWLKFFILLLTSFVYGDGNIGCLFSPNVCIKEVEWCYDDYIFGRCLQETVEADDLYRYEFLTEEHLSIIANELKRLLNLDYHWSHPYTQCLLQGILFAFKNNFAFGRNECNRYVRDEDDLNLMSNEGIDPLAIIRFMPSLSDPSTNFADEIYYPPSVYEQLIPEQLNDDNKNDDDVSNDINDEMSDDNTFDVPAVFDVEKKDSNGDSLFFIPAMHRRSYQRQLPLEYNTFETNSQQSENNDQNYQNQLSLYNDENQPFFNNNDEIENQPLYNDLNRHYFLNNDPNELLKYKKLQMLQNMLLKQSNYIPADFENDVDDQDFQNRVALIQEDMKAPRHSKYIQEIDGEPEEDFDDNHDEYENHRTNQNPFFLSPLRKKHVHLKSNQDIEPEIIEDDDSISDSNIPNGIYTEGGVVLMKDLKNSDNEKVIDNWGFKRDERLDVKKPGPAFNDKIIKHELNDKMKKSLDGSFDADSFAHSLAHHHYDVDESYAYVDFKDGIREWNEGSRIVDGLQKLLDLKPGTFSSRVVERNQVTFKVEPNNKGLNASQVAVEISNIKDKIKEIMGVEVTSTGIGYKKKKPLIWSSEWLGDTEQELFVSKLLIGCVLAALIMACITLGLVWRHATSRQKLQDMNASTMDTEASKDYQELCRSRMATKSTSGTTPCSQSQVVEKAESVHGRITSLSRESEQQSPSSRSSTSSWSEEPVLSNMDISTGHMVLSYMEDHLKNKDRLEQEWVALCAYEAEPCSTAIAQRPDNADKNRYPHVLPYDHARVVLSSLTNINESDYINASTITDHDPRNPAYIATQGPLPNTASDFWQMVWEQGSVVMVMLTRLTENGNAMCHRYWPEEGSEVYHIYEVHLVSEHIWCDDYLVRSFYLKNMKTGETRTVTQFHFLSWPEHGVPTSTKALLEFRRKVNKSYRGRSCPIIVHCSDGAGRTGTYCLIDMVLNRMSKGAKEIDIAATLEHIRDQRPAMVATKQQFEFVLMAVAEEVHAILKALPTTIEKQQ